MISVEEAHRYLNDHREEGAPLCTLEQAERIRDILYTMARATYEIARTHSMDELRAMANEIKQEDQQR